MYVSLPPELEQFVEESVRAGDFESADAVVMHALQALKFQHDELPQGDALEKMIEVGQEQAQRGELIPGDEVVRELLARNAARPRHA